MKLTAGLLWLLSAACAADLRASEGPGPSALTAGALAVVLTACAPRRDLPVSARSALPTGLALEIARIRNPSLQSFSVAVSVVWSAPGQPDKVSPVGVVTPFPANRPGTFQLSVPPPAGELLTRRTGCLALRIALIPIGATSPLPKALEVAIGEPRWR